MDLLRTRLREVCKMRKLSQATDCLLGGTDEMERKVTLPHLPLSRAKKPLRFRVAPIAAAPKAR